MESQLLRVQELVPTEDVLKDVLGDIYPVFDLLMTTVTGAGYGLAYEWNYYKDGKSWLCKVCHKKKTIFWLSVWEGYFQISLFFTEKHLEGIAALDIEESVKEDFCRAKPIGKLIPMIFKIIQTKQLDNLLKVIDFKKALK